MKKIKLLFSSIVISILLLLLIAPPALANPTITITSPTASSTVTGTSFTVTGTSTANTTIQISINGVLAGTTTSDGSGSWSYAATGQASGSKTISAKAIGGTYLYAGKGYGGTEEYIYDLATDTQIPGSPVSPTNPAPTYESVVSSDGSKIYYTSLGSTNVFVFDTNTHNNSILLDTGGVTPQGLVLSSNDSTLYVADNGNSNVYVIDVASATITATIALTNGSPTQLAISPDGSKIYVTSVTGANADIIDTATNTVTGSIVIGNNTKSVIFNNAGTKAYFATPASPANILVVDTATNAVTNTILVGNEPNDLAILPDDSKLYVANTFDNPGTVSVINTATNTVTTTLNNVGVLPVGIDNTPDGTSVYVVALGDLFGAGDNGGLWKINTANDSLSNIFTSAVITDGFVSNQSFIARQTTTASVTFTLAAAASTATTGQLAPTGINMYLIEIIAAISAMLGLALFRYSYQLIK